MPNLGYWALLLDQEFLVTALSAIAAFATILTLGLPYIKGNALEARMKGVAERREELRQKQRDAFAQNSRRGTLRSTPISFMKATLDNLKLEKILESPGMREKLARAGFRGQGPLVTFMFFRFIMPPIVFIGALVYIFGVASLEYSFAVKFLIAVAAAGVGFYLPDLFVTNITQKRQKSIMRAFPDSLDLLLICVEAGMSIEAAFNRVAQEVEHNRWSSPRNSGLRPPNCPIFPIAASRSKISRSAVAITASGPWRPPSCSRKNTARPSAKLFASRRRKTAKLGCPRPNARRRHCRPSSPCR